MEMIRARGSQNGVIQVPNLAANNLLQTFFIASTNHFCHRDGSENGENMEEAKKDEEEEDKDLELSLGLSLNGQFGTDPRSRKRKNFELSRSSSIPEGFVFDGQRSGRDTRQKTVGPAMFQLDRTRSLPVETDMDMEMETKRKTRAFLEFHVPTKVKNRGQIDHSRKDGFTLSPGRNGETAKTRAYMEFRASPIKEGTDDGRKDVFTLSPGRDVARENTRAFMKFQVPPTKEGTDHDQKDGFTLSPGSSGDVEKKRAFTEFHIPPRKLGTDHGRNDSFTLSPGCNGAIEKRGFVEFQVPPATKERTDHGRKAGMTPTPVNGKGKNGNVTKKTVTKNAEVSGMEKARNFLEDMPCVSTREVGADGKRVEGFLYWYGGNKEEVKIVCVCHGSFLSPTEFVKHGGVNVSDDGGDVTMNPLRHIVVKLPSSSL